MKIATLRYRNKYGTLLDEIRVGYLSAMFVWLLYSGYTLLGVECTDKYVA